MHGQQLDLGLGRVTGGRGLLLGDIALCPLVAQQQAPAAGHTTRDEIDLLTVHGILHLLGYDHGEPEEHKEMFGIQGRLLLEWQQTSLGKDPEEQ